MSSLNPLTFLGSLLSPSCVALSSNAWGVVSMLDAAIILCGNCSPPSVRLAKVVLTGNTNDIISRNVKKDIAVVSYTTSCVYPQKFTSKYYRKYLKFYK